MASIAHEVQGINRYRYSRSLVCLEELVEALTFAHYLRTQSLIRPDELSPIVEELTRKGAAPPEDEVMADASATTPAPEASSGQETDTAAAPPAISLTDDDYIYGIFDLTGEMMRFATTTTALTGKLATAGTGTGADDETTPRTIVGDMHDLNSFFEMLPRKGAWDRKLQVMRQSVQKVERLGYDLMVRGSERPDGWVPDLSTDDRPEED